MGVRGGYIEGAEIGGEMLVMVFFFLTLEIVGKCENKRFAGGRT